MEDRYKNYQSDFLSTYDDHTVFSQNNISVLTEPNERNENIEQKNRISESIFRDERLKYDDKYGLYQYEIRLFQKIEVTRIKNQIKTEREEFLRWYEHYREDLNKMYDIFIKDRILISYDKFVNLAYKCTETIFNNRKSKYTRPLV
jgi:hypothetical protein